MEKIYMAGVNAIHSADFVYDVAEDHGYYLLILTSTPMRFWKDGQPVIYPPAHAVLFTPQSRMKYGACQEYYSNDWIIFSSDEKYVTQFPLIATPFPVIDAEYCHSLFQLLAWEHAQENYETVISRLMEILFHKLELNTGRSEPESGYVRQLIALRKNIMNDPQKNWRVADMAEQLHISEGYLQTIYKKQFGTSCIEDVIQSRFLLACDYLTHTSMSISEIAFQCGYNSMEHFSRQFKRLCGRSPREFRQSE